jgi:hypothetical protein
MAIIKNRYWEGCGGRRTSFTAGRNVNYCNHYGKQFEVSSKS